MCVCGSSHCEALAPHRLHIRSGWWVSGTFHTSSQTECWAGWGWPLSGLHRGTRRSNCLHRLHPHREPGDQTKDKIWLTTVVKHSVIMSHLCSYNTKVRINTFIHNQARDFQVVATICYEAKYEQLLTLKWMFTILPSIRNNGSIENWIQRHCIHPGRGLYKWVAAGSQWLQTNQYL